jgi:hypothetical protein
MILKSLLICVADNTQDRDGWTAEIRVVTLTTTFKTTDTAWLLFVCHGPSVGLVRREDLTSYLLFKAHIVDMMLSSVTLYAYFIAVPVQIQVHMTVGCSSTLMRAIASALGIVKHV